jgi:hypothetical protein
VLVQWFSSVGVWARVPEDEAEDDIAPGQEDAAPGSEAVRAPQAALDEVCTESCLLFVCQGESE